MKEFWNQTIAHIPVPARLPFGAWWLVRNDDSGRAIRNGRFEEAEVAFVERFLQPGMTVLDLGAHHGYYTLLASKRVGVGGRVIAFEPSPRERRALRLHLTLNRCKNVVVQGLALGEENTESNLYVVNGLSTGCNSLRPPDVVSGTSSVSVRVARLDDWLAAHKIERIDFIKIDVEGAELSVLKSAEQLFGRRPRPVILAEVQDVRTQPWGYAAKEILRYLCERGYQWFSLLRDGLVQELDLSPDKFEGNFVACPAESISKLCRYQS